jgi:hypothetical protein
MIEPLVTIKGFAPPGLVDKLRRARWTKGNNGGVPFEDFRALKLGWLYLSRPGDEFSWMHVQATVEETNGQYFSVSGFAFPDVLHAVRTRPVVICGFQIEKYRGDAFVGYEIRVVPHIPALRN